MRRTWGAIVRGPIVHDESGAPRALVRPHAGEFATMLVVTAVAMVVLYAGLGGRNRALFASGATFFSPRTSLDDVLPLVPVFVIVYCIYFPLLFFFAVLTVRDRRVMYEGVVGYVGTALVGFLFFWLLPSRMAQPDLSSCMTASCGMLGAMYRLDEGFNIFPSMHVGYSMLVWLFFRRYMPELSRPVGAVVIAVVVSTLVCKRHYFVDIPAAIATASVVYVIARGAGPRLAKAMSFLGPAIVVVGLIALPGVARADGECAGVRLPR